MYQPSFWNQRYAQPGYAYGEAPNAFLTEALNGLTPGKILFPGEGEGRNAVYAATEGWTVDAFDQSEAGRDKAMLLAAKNNVRLNYQISGAADFAPEESTYDAIVLIFFHLPMPLRSMFHQKIASWLKPGGIVILEGFNKSQLGKASGGPQQLNMLWDKETVEADFSEMKISYLEEKSVILEEGIYHMGEASVIRMLATR